jgi:HSP20 family molecular chaperone IbpA
MSSFLQKLRGKGVVDGAEGEAQGEAHEAVQEGPAGVTQLPVDVAQTDSEIVIYAQIPGTDLSSLDVSIEGDNDVITIQGSSRRPEEIAHGDHGDVAQADHGVTTATAESVPIHIGHHTTESTEAHAFSIEECAWGQFFRQIILPQGVDAEHAQAKVKDGVLVLRLPLQMPEDNKIRMNVVKLQG